MIALDQDTKIPYGAASYIAGKIDFFIFNLNMFENTGWIARLIVYTPVTSATESAEITIDPKCR